MKKLTNPFRLFAVFFLAALFLGCGSSSIDPEPEVLGQLGSDEIDLRLKALAQFRQMEHLPDSAIGQTVDLLKHPNRDVRIAAADALAMAEPGQTELVDQLLEIHKSESDPIVRAVIEHTVEQLSNSKPSRSAEEDD